MCNIRSGSIWRQIYPASYLIEIVRFALFQPKLSKEPLQKFDLENVDQGHWIQNSQLCHSMANMKSHKEYFYVQDITFDLGNFGQFQVVEK